MIGMIYWAKCLIAIYRILVCKFEQKRNWCTDIRQLTEYLAGPEDPTINLNIHEQWSTTPFLAETPLTLSTSTAQNWIPEALPFPAPKKSAQSCQVTQVMNVYHRLNVWVFCLHWLWISVPEEKFLAANFSALWRWTPYSSDPKIFQSLCCHKENLPFFKYVALLPSFLPSTAYPVLAWILRW